MCFHPFGSLLHQAVFGKVPQKLEGLARGVDLKAKCITLEFLALDIILCVKKKNLKDENSRSMKIINSLTSYSKNMNPFDVSNVKIKIRLKFRLYSG